MSKTNVIAQVFVYEPIGLECRLCGGVNKEGFIASLSAGPMQLAETPLCLRCFTNCCRLSCKGDDDPKLAVADASQ